MADKEGAPLFLGSATQLVHQLSRLEGFGIEDQSAVIKLYEKFAGVTVQR